MAHANEHKTTDLDLVEQGSGNGEKPTTPAVNSQAPEPEEPSVLEVRTLRRNDIHAMN
jgi:hypothetical protein